jgi:hypothetical protein
MKLATVRSFALALPGVTEEPHHAFSSFRVRGKIFVTVPPEEEHLHIFVAEEVREQALAMHPAFLEKLLWGGKVVGLRATLSRSVPADVLRLVRSAWAHKAPAALAASTVAPAPARRSR